MTSFSDFVVGEPEADVAVAVHGPSEPILVGDKLDVTFTVSNAGPAPASNVTFTYPLPAGFSLQSVDPSLGSCNESDETVTCDLGGVPAAATAIIRMRVTATTAGTATHTGTVVATEIDPDATNNTASWASTATVDPMVPNGGSPADAAGPGASLQANESDARASSRDAATSDRREADRSGTASTSQREDKESERTRDLIWPAGAGRQVGPGSVPISPLGLGIVLAVGALLGVFVRVTRSARRRDITRSS